MKKQSFTHRLLFLFNVLLALVLIISYVLPWISPKQIPLLAVISLTVPFLILFNLIACIYWLLKLNKKALLSLVVLLLGFPYISSLVKLSSKEILLNDAVKVMSFNVRLFNHYEWNPNTETAENTFAFIKKQQPDILAFQEFYKHPELSLDYPYQYIKTKTKSNKFGQAIYSRYRIIHQGSLDFKNSANNIIFADIIKEKDTIRVYNMHLESLKISPDKEHFGEENSQKLVTRMENAFAIQAAQVDLFLKHEAQWKGKKIVLGDFNNTAFSWVYTKVAANKKDAFVEAGSGFGKTFNYLFPLRIDFILTDPSITVNHYKTYYENFSDHYPIEAQLIW